jgi:GIY-YIG catalytic domain
MPDYSLSKIYKLVSNKTTDIYIGSCLMRLSTRLSNHRSKNNTCVSRNLFTGDAIITIVLIESFACTTKNELKARELHYITTNDCINVNKPFVCEIPYGDGKAYMKEYQQANKEQCKASQQEYNASHRDQINTRQKVYDEANKEHKKDYEASHRDQINARRRALYTKKKQALNLESTLNNNITV